MKEKELIFLPKILNNNDFNLLIYDRGDLTLKDFCEVRKDNE